ncbi:transcription factor domain-containing protein [Aspergillus fischeri NRRL 181]|uniref:C6 transcription factor, putative n=1 Tax=Neosartorya fischeri (strain ATCC 1020 / DSM 3700 / CBS 544.65 / FGSC A1164 / JCM 1740 / NRRL 181 / WB 181) TaxID=331117 RepID=A1DFJ4_NEOFI|nr:C6 transcription factor, putative [Aspergillus fischeri NRRL 181]EAW18151.1 C6 transcription factor, putative [Aspergillus fischeri NRRL 181]
MRTHFPEAEAGAYKKALKERLDRVESLLKAAGLVDEENLTPPETSSDDGVSLEEDKMEAESDDELSSPLPHNSSEHKVRLFKSANQQSGLESSSKLSGTGDSQHVSIIRWDNKADSIYYGRSSSLSILSREGIEWIKHKTGEVNFLRLLVSDTRHDSPWDYWRPDVFHDVFASKVFKPLPPRAEVFSLLGDYFRTINRLFPLYHEASFMEMVEWQYTQQTCDDAARWASINVILALAYEYRYTNSLKSEKDKERAWLYYKNAMSVFTELTLRRTDMLSVQALLGMALFLRGNSGTQSAMPLITAAIRTCHRLGLHRDTPRPHLAPAEQEQRKRVFWIAFILDQSTCIRTGNAPTQHPDDFDVEIPAVDPENDLLLSDNKPFFQQLCQLTIIKSRIYTELYSEKALQNKTAAEVMKIVKKLHAELGEWRAANTFDDQLKQGAAGEDFLRGFASAGMQFVYFNSLILIHRMPLVIAFIYRQRLANGDSAPDDANLILRESSSSIAFCSEAARDTLRLVNNLPWGDIAWIWSLLYYVFLAVMTIFINILRDSRYPNVREDIQSLNMASTFFATLIPGDGPSNYARFMTQMSANFERIARSVVERDQKATKLSQRANSRASMTRAEGHDLASEEQRSQRNQPAEAPRSSPSSSPVHSPSIIDIPHLPGLPRINSSGYVVPDSSPPASDDLQPSSPYPPLENTYQNGAAPSESSVSPQGFNNPTYPFDAFFPMPVANHIPQSDFWQTIPVADWGLPSSNQFSDDPYMQGFFQGRAPSFTAPTTTATSSNVPSVPINMGFSSETPGQFVNDQGPSQSIWPGGGFVNPFS